MQRPKSRGRSNSIQAILVLCLSFPGVFAFADGTDAQALRYGNFEITFTLSQLLEADAFEVMSPIVSPDEEITWKMYVPESYDEDKPAGLMVYISPGRKGSMPRKWRSVIEDENLIWISANNSGNEITPSRRLLYAVLGPQIAKLNYAIDHNRTYLSGFSGGGRVASIVAVQFAHLFKGAIYICGALHWEQDPPELFEQIKTNRYVFLSGDDDFNLEETMHVYGKYRNAGLSNVTMIRIPRMGHDNPDKKGFRKAIAFLDAQD